MFGGTFDRFTKWFFNIGNNIFNNNKTFTFFFTVDSDGAFRSYTYMSYLYLSMGQHFSGRFGGRTLK